MAAERIEKAHEFALLKGQEKRQDEIERTKDHCNAGAERNRNLGNECT